MVTTRALSEATLAAVSEAVLGVAGERSVDAVLQRLVGAARELVGARYAALGVPDAEGTGFSRFITAGMSDDLVEAIGPLPRAHGLLGTLLASLTPYRTDDVSADPRFTGWPEAHPRMRSFLGVPIVFKGDVIGALYLADKEGGAAFDFADERLIALLAAHAAVAMEHARLHEASRELSIVEERNRLARELHDVVVQTLFSLSLTTEAAASLVRRDPSGAEAEMRRAQELAGAAMAQLRSLVFELRPPDLERDGLVPTVRKQLELVGRIHGLEVELHVEGDAELDPASEVALLRIVHEALNNAVHHASADRIEVRISLGPDTARITVADDGVGFDPASPRVRSRRLGLTSMRERALERGGRLTVDSGAGHGTKVEVELPGG
ncbi:MAG TPA: GAF domain-containing sensor histidine kinase [Acidimicrobiales bacterium]|nr:GAF domain-containing sensor histidine kinase [Acidimicrobiales bacterium]